MLCSMKVVFVEVLLNVNAFNVVVNQIGIRGHSTSTPGHFSAVEEICSWVFGWYQGYRFRRKIGGRNSLKQVR